MNIEKAEGPQQPKPAPEQAPASEETSILRYLSLAAKLGQKSE